MAARTVALLGVLFVGMCIMTSAGPTEVTHAFCNIGWLLGLPCDQVTFAILTQIGNMGSYELSPVTSGLIEAKHTSADGQIENVNFTMRPVFMEQGCHVEGSSVSEFWYSKFDNNTNYCNLHNVILGSGLTRAPGFTEFTNAWSCLGYGRFSCKWM